MLVEKWNAQRAQALAHTLMKVLYPQMEKELRTKLLLEAKEHVLQVCLCSHLYSRYSMFTKSTLFQPCYMNACICSRYNLYFLIV